MDLERIFDEVSVQLRSDFEKTRHALDHAGLKGSANEGLIKAFLEHYFPKALAVSSGIVVDSYGRTSRQLDVIIHDAAKTPVFYRSGEDRVIPIECVYAAIEVKAYLSKCELFKSFQNMDSLKSLSKNEDAFFNPSSPIQSSITLYGRSWPYWPVQHYIFAFDSPDLDSVHQNLSELQGSRPLHMRIDAACVLSRGVLVNRTLSGMYQITPEPSSDLVISLTTKRLLFFHSLMSILLNQATMKNFNILPYLRNMRF